MFEIARVTQGYDLISAYTTVMPSQWQDNLFKSSVGS